MQVPGLNNIIAVTNTLALRSDGTVWDLMAPTPYHIEGLNNMTAVSRLFAVRNDGTVWHIWYREQVPGLNNVAAISSNWGNTLVMREDGSVWSWGDNTFGQIGDGTTTDRATPVQVRGPGGVGFLNLGPAAAQPDIPFTDVGDTWYRDAVTFVYERGLMTGTSSTTFAPSQNLTRAQLVTILWRMEGEPNVAFRPIFNDVLAGQWYSTAVIWAFDNGVVSGTGPGTFAPHNNITREQFATMMHNYARFAGHNTSVPANFNLNQFTDAGAISGWALEAMRWANFNGLITGTTATTLSPQGTANRAQCAAILMRYVQTFVD